VDFAISIGSVKQLSAGLWKAAMSPAHARMLAANPNSVGSVSVLMLTAEPIFDARAKTLSFTPESAHVLNIGSTDDAVVVLGSSLQTSAGLESVHAAARPALASGDSAFLQQLSPALRELGTAFLQSVRKHFPGSLAFHPRSQKFVESPDNFWTVRIQPRDRSLRITVRGRPEMFSTTTDVELKADMGSYSNFKIAAMNQIPAAIRIIREAATR
jgi:hypothetical protein